MRKKEKNTDNPELLLPGLLQENKFTPGSKISVEVEVLRKGKIRRSGHLTDNMLKYSLPSKQPSLFDDLQEETKKAIESTGKEIREVAEGIKLTPSETKVIDSLCKLLHEKSQNTEPGKDNYYTGNFGYELTNYGTEKTAPAPKLGFTLYELTKEYKGGEVISGKDLDNVRQVLTDLDNKKFLISYTEITSIKGGGRIENKIDQQR